MQVDRFLDVVLTGDGGQMAPGAALRGVILELAPWRANLRHLATTPEQATATKRYLMDGRVSARMDSLGTCTPSPGIRCRPARPVLLIFVRVFRSRCAGGSAHVASGWCTGLPGEPGLCPHDRLLQRAIQALSNALQKISTVS